MRRIFNILVYIFAVIGFVLIVGYLAIRLGWTKTAGIIDNQHDFFKSQVHHSKGFATSTLADEAWTRTEEWSVLKAAIIKDADSIDKAAAATGVPARMIVAPLVVEQLRLFYTDREVFKSVFAPLKILGVQSQFSWGVMGIKQDTAIAIENHLADSQSPWYLGPEYSHLLDYSGTSSGSSGTVDRDAERFAKLTSEHDRYYSYLYAALCIKEIETQWKNASFPIENRPDILATLFNIGFGNSHPNTNPQSGGAEIDIGTTTYSFGGLAGSFYDSSELIDIFPRD